MLTVLNVAYPFAPVGADAVGGAEQVLAQLDAALTTVALAAGCRANVPVLLAGQVYPYEAHEGYLKWPMPFAKSIASIPRSVELSRRAVSAEPNDAPVPRSL